MKCMNNTHAGKLVSCDNHQQGNQIICFVVCAEDAQQDSVRERFRAASMAQSSLRGSISAPITAGAQASFHTYPPPSSTITHTSFLVAWLHLCAHHSGRPSIVPHVPPPPPVPHPCLLP